ncbi:MAG: hypothetical protein NC409_00210 [Clostridium sp.]|nr:hypothetical protein [Clostridium sp.]
MQERIIKLVLLAILIIILLLLSATPVFRGSKEQRRYRKQGMRILAVPRMRILILPALGIFVMGFLAIFAYLAIADGAWEEAGSMILLALGIGLVILIGGFFAGYCMQKRHILYDEEQLLVGSPFHPYQRWEWRALSRMEIKNQDVFSLYDRDGVRRVSATADLTGYHDFYETAMRHLRPENEVKSGDAGAYQRAYSANAGEGMLRYRTGEYAAMLVISLLAAIMVVVMGALSGEDMGAWIVSKQGWETKLLVVGLVTVSVVCLIYTSLQKITYDRMQITFARFPKGSVTVGWTEVQRVNLFVSEGSRIIMLYTPKKNYEIKEKQFRRGFSEFVLELQRRYGAPQQGGAQR